MTMTLNPNGINPMGGQAAGMSFTDPNQLFHFTQGVGTDRGDLPIHGYVKTDPVLTSVFNKDTITLRIISLPMLSVRIAPKILIPGHK